MSWQLRYCSLCVLPDTMPQGADFSADGLCVQCKFQQSGLEVDYSQRMEELEAYVAAILATRKDEDREWDCIVGVSGGKDSTRQALWVRERLGLEPLLVSVSYPPRQISEDGVANLSNLVRLGFDMILVNPAPITSRKLVRAAFLRFANWCKATEMALFSGVQRTALQLGIPVIFWGENTALQFGDMGTLGSSIWDGNRVRHSNTLGGGDLGWFSNEIQDFKKLFMYSFPPDESFEASGTKVVFLGPAWSDWSSSVNSQVSVANNMSPRSLGLDASETGDPLGTQMVDEDWTVVNFMVKYYKLGFSRGSELASELIRAGEITREEGVVMAEELDGACSDRLIDSFCQYIGITKQTFWETVKSFSDPRLFEWRGLKPVRKFRVGQGF